MGILENSKEKGFAGIIGSIKSRFNKSLDYYSTMLYYVSHHDLSPAYYDDLSHWRVYSKMKKKYSSFLDKLPDYKMVDVKTKIIWWCWFQGEKNAPDLCKKCLNSLRVNFPDYEVKVVCEDNVYSLVDIPEYVREKYRKGCFSMTHFSDIIRTLLLVKYGGVWIDSTVYCTGNTQNILDYPFFVYQNWKFNREESFVASSWLISANQGDPILSITRDLLFEYWKKNDSLKDYFLFHLFFRLATEKNKEEWNQLPRFSNITPHYLQFELFDDYNKERFNQIKNSSDFHKLTYKDYRIHNGVEGSFYNKLFLNTED